MGNQVENRGRLRDIRLLIVDEQVLFGEGLKAICEQNKNPRFGRVSFVSSAKACLAALEKFTFDVISLELNLQDLDGLKLIKRIKEDYSAKILVITAYRDPKFCKQAFMSGADGYILKENQLEEFQSAVKNILLDQTYMGRSVRLIPANNDLAIFKSDPKYQDAYQLRHKLTKREREVLHLISEAKTNKQIAKDLFISDQTVSVHRKNIMRKLGVKNTASLIKKAVDKSLI